MRRTRALVTVIALCALAAVPVAGTGTAAAADPAEAVLDWNAHAIAALINAPTAPTPGAGQPPPVAVQHLAMVQGAVYDAVNAIVGSHQPYLDGVPAADPSASQPAAVATAAYEVLVGVEMVPPFSQTVLDRLEDAYEDSLEAVPDGPAEDAGVAAGHAAASAMLAAREDDGRYGPFRFTVGTEPGEWQLTPPGFVNDPFAWVADVTPFTLRSTSQFGTNGPPALHTGDYAREYDEVLRLGSTTATSSRNPEQEALAQFYTVNPVELYNRTFRAIAAAEGLDLAEQARLFAMLDLAGADALINCWDDKAEWSFWRPITAIHQGDDDGNQRTIGDPDWAPLLAAPPYPDHPSGYNCVTGAMMTAAREFFGSDEMGFSVVRIVPGVPDVTRDYERFSAVLEDTIDARVYQGLHFRSADEEGARIGRHVALWLAAHFFEPT
jgi:hypothetical protein